VHPLRRRVITPHEAARIQSFPDSFSFVPSNIRVSRKHLNKWIGDAVPPMLAYAAALGAIAAIVDGDTHDADNCRRHRAAVTSQAPTTVLFC
jgi:site-specific DNA-cytosine methylase